MTDRYAGQASTAAAPSPDDLRIGILRTVEAVEALRPFWEACAGHRDAQIDFYLHIVATYPEVRRPHTLAVYRGDRPVALLLGRFEEKSIGATVGYLHLPTPRLRLLNFLYGGRLGEADEAIDRALIDSILASLGAGEADAALLHYPALDSPLYRLATSLPRFWRRDHALRALVHRAMAVPIEPAALLAKLPAKEQSNHNRRSRRLRREFGTGLKLECLTAEAEVPRLAAAAELVAGKSYQRALGVGFRDDPAMRRRLALEARLGTLRGYVLYLGNEAAAYWIVSCRGGVIYNDFLAYDPAYARYAPGMYVVVEALEALGRAAPRGMRLRLDFGMGESEWKASWGDEAWLEGNVYIYGGSLRALATTLIRTLAAGTAIAARALLARTGLRDWLKQRWRLYLAARQK